MRSASILSLFFLFAVACDNSEAPLVGESLEPGLVRLDPVHFQESDTLYVGRIASLAVDPADGSFFVSDSFWGRVLRFSPSGGLIQVYGSRGEGPGELKDPGPVAVAGDEVLVGDPGRNLLTRYGREGGAFLGSVRHEGYLTSIHADGETIWMGVQNRDRRTALASWSRDSDAVRYLGPLPDEFIQSRPLAGIYTGIQVASWGDSLLVGFMGLNRLQLLDRVGALVDTVAVPARHRRGQMKDLVQRLPEMEFPEMFAANSALFRLHRLPSGSFALIHHDQTIEGDFIAADVYLSLLSSGLRESCADRKVPVSADAQPYTAFRGDTLFVLQQRVEGEQVTAFIDRYRIDEAACFPGVSD